MEISTKATTVDLRSNPQPDGEWPVNRGLAPGGEFTMTAHTDEERVIIEPLFNEFAATVVEALQGAGLVADDARNTARALRDLAATQRTRSAGWVHRATAGREE